MRTLDDAERFEVTERRDRTLDIRARSWEEANRELPASGEGWGVVSMGCPGTDSPNGFDSENPYHVRLEMDDVVSPMPSGLAFEARTPPQEDHARRLLLAAPALLRRPTVYCHCRVGRSRSTAAAYVLWCWTLGSGEEQRAFKRVREDRPQAKPNVRFVKHADDLMGRGGKMVDVLP